MEAVRTYYQLAKPGIIRGNLLTATAGFLVASGTNIGWLTLTATLVSIALIIGSACTVNNYIDRDIDIKMARTKGRALAQGVMPAKNALIYALALGIAGFSILAVWTNWLTVLIGLIGYVDYVAIYTFSKRKTWHATLIGSICGSMPVVAGYTAVTGRLDAGALILFLILTSWQMPHFYAIALRRLDDYKAAKVPVLPAVRGAKVTRLQIVAYMIIFFASVLALGIFGYAGTFYLVAMGLLSAGWLVVALRRWHSASIKRWATSVFLYSLLLLPGFMLVVLIDALLAK